MSIKTDGAKTKLFCIGTLALCASGPWGCPVAGTATSTVVPNTPASPTTAAPAATATPTPVSPAGGNVTVMQQSGSGWNGNVNVAVTSQNYQGLSLDQLLASTAGLGQALQQHAEIVAAIRRVNQETGVPGGLLAGVIYQESGFDVGAVSKNPDPTPQDTQDIGLCQCPQSDFTGDTWKDPYTNINVFVTKYFLVDYQHNHSWGIALRNWNSGEVKNPNDLSIVSNGTDPNYVFEILATHCMGLD